MSSHNKSSADKRAAGLESVHAWIPAQWVSAIRTEAAHRETSLAGLITEWAKSLEKLQARRNRLRASK